MSYRYVRNLTWFILLYAAQPTIIAYGDSYPYKQQNSRGFHLLDLDSFSMTAAKFGDNRDPMLPQQQQGDWTGRAAAEFNLRLAEVFYWNNNVHTEGVSAQVKTVGWHWELGLHASKYLDFFYEHHSRHVMEGSSPQYIDPSTGIATDQKYPVEDSYGIRLKFYINDRPHRNLIGD